MGISDTLMLTFLGNFVAVLALKYGFDFIIKNLEKIHFRLEETPSPFRQYYFAMAFFFNNKLY